MKESLEKKQKVKNNFRTAFIRCDCDSEILVIGYDYELEMVDLCIYENYNSFKNKMNWFQKLRYIYQVMRHGRPYTDQIVLKKEQIEELVGFLTSL